MKYSALFKNDLINGDGIRVSLFVSGCSHGCKGCYNESAWKYNYGNEYTSETENTILTELSKKHVSGLSLLGGDPLMPKNYNTVLNLCKTIKKQYPNKNIWLWSGYTLNEIKNNHSNEILQYIDVLIDGKFVQELYKKMPLRGSTNQMIYRRSRGDF